MAKLILYDFEKSKELNMGS